MPPTATRWLCLLLILLVQDARCQLSVGGADAFLPDDLGAADDTAIDTDPGISSLADAVTADANIAANAADTHAAEVAAHEHSSLGATVSDASKTLTATNRPPEEATLPDLATESGGQAEGETGAMEDPDHPTDFDIGPDSVGEVVGTASALPQLTRRIVYSGGISVTPTIPEPTVSSSRPSSVVRGLDDPRPDDWLPNWPSELLADSDRPERRPTLRFPTESIPTVLVALTPIPSSIGAPDPSPVPSITPSFTVSKVPITQYFFDLTSVSPTPVPGPLFDEGDLNGPVSALPSGPPDRSQIVTDLSSSIPELQSSVFLESAGPISVTPLLSESLTSVTEAGTALSTNRLAATPVSTMALFSTSTRLDETLEKEMIDNNLDEEVDGDNTALMTEGDPDLDLDTTGPRPPVADSESPIDDLDDYEYTTTDEVFTETSPADVPTLMPGIDELQPVSFPYASSAEAVSAVDSELVTTASTNTLRSVKPTFTRTSQATEPSRTPLWMLLSHSSPTRTVNTRLLNTQLTTLVATTSAIDTMTALATTPSSTEENLTDTPVLNVSPTPALEPSTHSSERLPETLIQSPASSLDDPSTEGLQDSGTSFDVTTSPVQTESTVIIASISASPVSTVPTIDNTASSTLEPPSDISPELTPVTDSPINPSDEVLHLDTVSSTKKIPVTPETTESTLDLTDTTLDQSSSPHLIEESTPGNATEINHESSEEPPVITLSEDAPLIPDSFPIEGEVVTIVGPTEVNSVGPPTDSATWTPVIELTGNTVQRVSVTSPSSTITTTSTVSLVPPEMTGGFTPIKSETTHSSHTSHSELEAKNSSIPSPTSATEVVKSTIIFTAPFDGSSTPSAPLPSVTDFPATTTVQETDESESVMTIDHFSPGEHATLSVITKGEVVSSPIAFPTTIQTSLKDETASVPLFPAFTEPIPTLSSDTIVSEVDSTLIEKKTEPTIIVTERLPSSPTIYIPEIFPSSSGSSVLATPSATEITNSSSVPLHTSIIPQSSDSLINPHVPISSASVAILPTASTDPTLDSSTLVTPTATDDTTKNSTQFIHPDEPAEDIEEGTHEEPAEKEESADTSSSSSSSTTSIPTPVTVTTPTTTTTTTKTSTTRVTARPTTSTSPVSTASTSEVPSSVSPTETMPSLTTTMILPNGTLVEHPLPYIRALVAYSSEDFCHHKHNFSSMLAQWISQHLDGKAYVEPHEIEFFNMPECDTTKSPTEDHINHFNEEPENNLNLLKEEDEQTNVYFYISSSGKIDPYLTEQFPLFPMDLKISEELNYLKTKVSQLELVRADGSTNSDLLMEEEAAVGTSVIVIIVICSIVGVTIILALLFFMVVKRRGSTNNYYGRRCTPVSMDSYSMDSVSVYHSFRRKSKRRASGRSVKSYLNQAFDDPNGPSRPLNFAKLTHFISDIDGVHEEFGTIPVNMPKYDELPVGVEDKNRYANVIPVPETRVLLKLLKDSHNSEYINANHVRGARNESKYYIATQAPLDDTVADFWRMIWEQETKVVVMLTDFVEKGIDKCADYLPPSETLDCHRLYGDFQVTLKSRDMREKFVVSNVQLKNLENNLVREVAHMWFTGWPSSGVPNEETAFISYILDVRRTRKKLRSKGPVVVHCSPGTGRTGTFLACDMVMRQFEDQRCVDVPRTVYSIRRDRAGAVQTKEQYAFIYRVINLYASKLTSGNLDSL